MQLGPTEFLHSPASSGSMGAAMSQPSQPVSLSVEQINELNRKFSTMRHDVNNHLSLMVAAMELIRHKPQTAERMLATLAEQPPKISEAVRRFSAEFEQALAITRP